MVAFHVAVVLQALCVREEQVIAFLLPGYSDEVSSMWHARRMRYDNRGSTGAARSWRSSRALLFLDTSVGESGATRFYELLGYTLAGGIPDFAADPDGRLAER